jgi:hypothetical protein
MFLSEARQRKEVVEGLIWRLGLKHVISFHEEGKGGVASWMNLLMLRYSK